MPMGQLTSGHGMTRLDALHRHGARRVDDGGRSGNDIDIRRVLLAAKRRLWLIVVIALIVTGLSCGVGMLMTPRYKAELSLVLTIKDGSNSNSAIGGMSGGINSRDTPQLSSAIDVLTSSDTVRRVVQSLGLDRDPEWNPTLQPPGITAGILRMLPFGLGSLLQDDAKPPTAEEQAAMTEEAVRKRLSVTNDGKSYTIVVSFTSVDPVKAATIANAIADTYAAKELSGRAVELDRMSNLLLQRSDGLRARVIQTELAVQTYKEKNGIVDLDDNKTLVNDTLAKLNSELVSAQSERAKAQGMLANLRDFAHKQSGEAAAKVAAISPNLAALVDQRNQVRASLADLGTTYSIKYPKFQEMTSRSHEVDAQLTREIEQAMGGLQARVDVARANEAEIARSVTRLTSTNTANARATTELRQLVADAATAHSLYQTFLDTAGRAAVESYALAGNARIEAHATPPAFPAFPRMPIVLLIGGLSGLLIAIACAIALEATRKEVRTPEEVRDEFGEPALALLPYLAGARSRDNHAARVMSMAAIENPLGEQAEALRSVGVALATSPGLRSSKVVLITSALPGEGKTSLAVSLARLAAASGRSVLLVECDLRRPAVNNALGVVAATGLTDVLEGRRSLQETTYEDAVSGMHFIPSGARARFPAEALGSAAMRGIVSASRDRFDLVILDTPPVGVVADALVLSGVIDAAILVVRWGKTPRRAVEMALDRLRFAGVRMAGVVLSQVRMKQLAQYGSAYRSAGVESYFETTRSPVHVGAGRLG
jgi:polysaccharide biosynthesis transport protein